MQNIRLSTFFSRNWKRTNYIVVGIVFRSISPSHTHSSTGDCQSKPRFRCNFFFFIISFVVKMFGFVAVVELSHWISLSVLFVLRSAHTTHMQTLNTTQHNNVAVISIVFFYLLYFFSFYYYSFLHRSLYIYYNLKFKLSCEFKFIMHCIRIWRWIKKKKNEKLKNFSLEMKANMK